MKLGIVSIALVAMSLTPLATATYSEGFESGTAAGWTLTGLWNVNSCVVASGAYALNYNAFPQCNYDTGTNSGTATSPSFTVSATSPGTFTFDSYTSTEGGCYWDEATVRVSVNGGPFSDVLPSVQCSAPQGSWQLLSIDLAPYAGTNVQVQFSFNTKDGLYNNYAGWAIDNVAITGAALPTPELGTMLLTGAGLVGLAGIVVIQRRK